MRVPSALFLFVLISLVSPCFADPVPSSELISKAKEYNGKTVVYSGEVVGDVMRRGNFFWVNLNDGVNAIGIWVESSLLPNISYTGSYASKGDILEVEGIFRRSCPEHGGDLDIHAAGVLKVSSGSALNEGLSFSLLNRTAFLSTALLAVFLVMLIKKRA